MVIKRRRKPKKTEATTYSDRFLEAWKANHQGGKRIVYNEPSDSNSGVGFKVSKTRAAPGSIFPIKSNGTTEHQVLDRCQVYVVDDLIDCGRHVSAILAVMDFADTTVINSIMAVKDRIKTHHPLICRKC